MDYSNSQIIHIIDEYIHSERDRKIMVDRLVNGICYEPLAERYDLSIAQIKRIVYKCQTIIFKHL